jgi:hypothetical protein
MDIRSIKIMLKRNVRCPFIGSLLYCYRYRLQAPKGFDFIIVLFIVMYLRPTNYRNVLESTIHIHLTIACPILNTFDINRYKDFFCILDC